MEELLQAILDEITGIRYALETIADSFEPSVEDTDTEIVDQDNQNQPTV